MSGPIVYYIKHINGYMDIFHQLGYDKHTDNWLYMSERSAGNDEHLSNSLIEIWFIEQVYIQCLRVAENEGGLVERLKASLEAWIIEPCGPKNLHNSIRSTDFQRQLSLEKRRNAADSADKSVRDPAESTQAYAPAATQYHGHSDQPGLFPSSSCHVRSQPSEHLSSPSSSARLDIIDWDAPPTGSGAHSLASRLCENVSAGNTNWDRTGDDPYCNAATQRNAVQGHSGTELARPQLSKEQEKELAEAQYNSRQRNKHTHSGTSSNVQVCTDDSEGHRYGTEAHKEMLQHHEQGKQDMVSNQEAQLEKLKAQRLKEEALKKYVSEADDLSSSTSPAAANTGAFDGDVNPTRSPHNVTVESIPGKSGDVEKEEAQQNYVDGRKTGNLSSNTASPTAYTAVYDGDTNPTRSPHGIAVKPILGRGRDIEPGLPAPELAEDLLPASGPQMPESAYGQYPQQAALPQANRNPSSFPSEYSPTSSDSGHSQDPPQTANFPRAAPHRGHSDPSLLSPLTNSAVTSRSASMPLDRDIIKEHGVSSSGRTDQHAVQPARAHTSPEPYSFAASSTEPRTSGLHTASARQSEPFPIQLSGTMLPPDGGTHSQIPERPDQHDIHLGYGQGSHAPSSSSGSVVNHHRTAGLHPVQLSGSMLLFNGGSHDHMSQAQHELQLSSATSGAARPLQSVARSSSSTSGDSESMLDSTRIDLYGSGVEASSAIRDLDASVSICKPLDFDTMGSAVSSYDGIPKRQVREYQFVKQRAPADAPKVDRFPTSSYSRQGEQAITDEVYGPLNVPKKDDVPATLSEDAELY